MKNEKLKELIKAYKLVLEDCCIIKPEYIGLNMFKILDEWIESPDLLGFPKELQIELCKSIRRLHDNLSIISFKQIVSILHKNNYEYIDDVITGMKKFDALNRGYLILISVDVDENTDFSKNRTLMFIKDNFNDIYDNAYSIFSEVYNNRSADGLTVIHRDEYDPENAYTCVYINRKAANMKDTLEHEICHFIKNVANHSDKFPKTYSGVTPDKIKDRKYECVVYLRKTLEDLGFSKNTLDIVSDIATRAFTEREEQPTIKSIVNAFIRRYENDKARYDFNHLLKTIAQIECSMDEKSIKAFRLAWLKSFLDNVNSGKLFLDNKDNMESYFANYHRERDYEIEFLLKCMSYLCFKKQYPEYDIDRIITENFRQFKFRDV